jgi:hypothetical protein
MLFGSVTLTRYMGWGLVVPTATPRGLEGLRAFVAYVLMAIGIHVQLAVVYLAVLVLAGLMLRNAKAAWIALLVVPFALYTAWGSVFLGPHPAVVLTFALILAATSAFVLWRTGLLALATCLVVIVVFRDTPWTLALTQWYAWPTWFTTALIAALTFWGLKNVLGRQSAFPAM